jgi:hypothetical protein
MMVAGNFDGTSGIETETDQDSFTNKLHTMKLFNKRIRDESIANEKSIKSIDDDLCGCCMKMALAHSRPAMESRLIDYIQPNTQELETQKMIGRNIAKKTIKKLTSPDIITKTDMKRSLNAHKGK